MFEASWIDKYLLTYVQHGLDQGVAYAHLLQAKYDPSATYLQKLTSYKDVLLAVGDPRVKNWPLMDYRVMIVITLGYLWTIAALYLLMKYVRPMSRYESGKGFNVKPIALVHNIVLTALSAYMFAEIVNQAFITGNYRLFGNAVDRKPSGLGMAKILWVFYVSKILEFVDTMLMCLRKSFRQISFLHVYHHSSIFVIWWIVVYYVPGGDAYFSAMLNSFIHVLMYGYYLWSSLSPKLKEGQRPTPSHPAYYRQYITTGQMLQFTLNLIQSIYLVTVPSGFPRWAAWLLFGYMLTMLTLFGNFAYQQYGSKARSKARKVSPQQSKKVQ